MDLLFFMLNVPLKDAECEYKGTLTFKNTKVRV